ncbi:MAG: hypothetical protein PHO41_09140, partial [Eubacteriales bacterium]|nr:hypothetical protein [Eubacteriales bacterium]
MARRRRGRQTRRRGRRINIGKLALILLIAAVVLVGVYFLIRILTDDNGSGGILPQLGKATPTPAEATATPIPTPTPTPALSESLRISPVAEANPNDFGFETDIMVSGEIVESYKRSPEIAFGKGDEYSELAGIIAFGGSNYRRSFTYGTQTVTEQKLTRIWSEEISSLNTSMGTWTGTGWTGMPVIIQWPEETRKVIGVADEFKNKDGFTEVIYPTMDGNIYFMELETGKRTREPINIGATTKGTAALDPRGYPLLYTGQGIPSTEDGTTGAWFRIIDLIQNKIVWKFGGVDGFSHRKWQAYDSSALIDAETDTLIAPGENGVLYTVKLNSKYDPAAGTVSVAPEGLVKYRYKGDGYGFNDENDKRWPGIENSVAAWRNYVFFTDNGGRLQCVDINTLQLQYVVDVTDDSDCSLVLEEDYENDTFYLYTANEVDKQPGAASAGVGKSYHRKIDGLTGKIVWEVPWEASIGNTSSNGGTLTTPHVGHGDIADLVIYNATLVPVTFKNEDGETVSQNGGRIVTYDKQTGKEIARYEQAAGYWSSPVVIYDENEKAYLLQCDRSGILR